MRRLSASSALLLTSHRSLMKSSIFKSARITFVICAIRSIDSHEQPKVLTVAPSPEKLPNLSRHAFGVDDVAWVPPVPKPALRTAHTKHIWFTFAERRRSGGPAE